MKEDFAKGIKALREIETPCNWEDFCQQATETLPGYVFIGQLEYDKAAHYGFYKFSIYSYADESQQELVGEDTFQAWLEDGPDGGRTVTNIR